MVDRLHFHRFEGGASTVEMALITVLLFLLVAGVVDLGRAYVTHIAVHDAAQEGALFASYRPTDGDEIRDRVISTTANPDLGSATIDITCPDGSPLGGGSIAVRVTYRMNLITPIVGPMLGGHIDLTREHIGTVFSGECLS